LPFIKRNIMFYRLKLNSKVVQANQEEPAKRKIQEFIEDETLIKVGNQFAWLLWIAVDSINKKLILGIHISFERTILVAE
jgi:transposase-like protein